MFRAGRSPARHDGPGPSLGRTRLGGLPFLPEARRYTPVKKPKVRFGQMMINAPVVCLNLQLGARKVGEDFGKSSWAQGEVDQIVLVVDSRGHRSPDRDCIPLCDQLQS